MSDLQNYCVGVTVMSVLNNNQFRVCDVQSEFKRLLILTQENSFYYIPIIMDMDCLKKIHEKGEPVQKPPK
jgi:hypothetical protein